MLKRTISILLAVVIALSVSACGDTTPDHLTNETYSLGKDALNTMDDYLAEEIDTKEADEQLSSIMEQLETEADSLSKKSGAGDIEATEYKFYNSTVSFWISSFAMGMYGAENAYGNTYDCQSVRDSLAEVLEVN